MSQAETAQTMRSKILGVLIKDARQVRELDLAACAAAAGCSTEALAAIEDAQASPSLPELELLAYVLDVPLNYFWGDTVLSEQRPSERAALPAAEVAAIRQRIVGALLRQARLTARLEPGEVAASAGVTPEQLAAYELGQDKIPLPTLEALAGRLGVPIEHFLEDEGPVGEWNSTQRAFERFSRLAPELREFVSRPINESYLRLAQRLSRLPAGELRGIAASLLEITY
jgi:transcriptional regulator with XRE-family HTH domain